MTQFDVFNGDADGICALQQLRLVQPAPDSTLVTGVKRDIALVKRVNATLGDHLTILDISFDKNRDALLPLLDAGAQVTYYDHHFAGDIPEHANLTTHIDTQAETCTSLIVNQQLKQQHWLWAAAGAFGDNFDNSALSLFSTHSHAYTQDDIKLIKNLGIYINYNAYGATPADLYITPEKLFYTLNPYANPLNFIRENDTYQLLENGYQEDSEKAKALTAEFITEAHALYLLPADPWARRVSGVFANELAQQAPARAHALVTQLPEGGYMVSVRAPLNTREGADELCRQFATGGGRKAAAGINKLPESELPTFISAFQAAYP